MKRVRPILRQLAATSTGVPILPRDTAGYMIDGALGSYQTVRAVLEYYAKHQPENRAEYARQARHLNTTHLRRLLTAAVREKFGFEAANALDRWGIDNLPRAQRRWLKRTNWSYDFAPPRSGRYRTGQIPPPPEPDPA